MLYVVLQLPILVRKSVYSLKDLMFICMSSMILWSCLGTNNSHTGRIYATHRAAKWVNFYFHRLWSFSINDTVIPTGKSSLAYCVCVLLKTGRLVNEHGQRPPHPKKIYRELALQMKIKTLSLAEMDTTFWQ